VQNFLKIGSGVPELEAPKKWHFPLKAFIALTTVLRYRADCDQQVSFCCTDESCISARFSDSPPSFSIDTFSMARFIGIYTSESKMVNKINSFNKYHSFPATVLREVALLMSRSGNNCSCWRSLDHSKLP